MSNPDAGLGPDTPAEEVTPAESGPGEPEATPEPSYFDPTEYADRHVRLKVDGEEVAVPLSEALAGYQRQADYTRKTQALAEQQRQAQFGMTLAQALEANPQETLRILQSQYVQPEPEPEPDWTDDPTEARLRQYEQRLTEWEAKQAQNDLRVAVGVLQQRYGEDFDPQEVISRAHAMGRMDLENVYKEIAFDRRYQGEQAARAKLAEEEAQRIGAKSQASNSVHMGGGAANTVAPDADNYPSIEEAFEAAKRQLGWT